MPPIWPARKAPVPEHKKILSAAQGVEAGRILFALNTQEDAALRMLAACGIPAACCTGDAGRRLHAEWCAFVHAAVTSSLMQHAPNTVLLAYLRQTGSLLAAAGTTTPQDLHKDIQTFVDGPFAAYMPLLAQEQPQRCPALFCQRVLPDLPPGQALPVQARLAAAMALLLGALNDKLDQYDIRPD